MTLSIAFIAGLISFLSPCVMPLIPGYISYISGTSLEELAKKKRSLVFLKTIFFTLGFSFVFIVLGSTASYLGKLFLINSNTFRILAGIIIIIFSLLLLKVIDLKFLNKDLRIFTDKYSNNLYFPFLVGAAFGFGWTPCIGPILGSILTLSALEQNINKSILLLSSYSFGLAIPFIISGVLIDKFLTFSKSIKKYITLITKLGGIILLLTGFAILTGQLQVLGFFILENIPYLSNLG
mgnify:FL=1